jgi:hypothetical protein
VTGIVWPDVEAAFITYMTAALAARPEAVTDDVLVSNLLPDERPERAVTDDVLVSNLLPDERPERAVIVRDDGGPVLGDVRAVARLGVRVWALTREDATDLAALVAALLTLWPDGKPVLTARPSRAYPLPDESGQPSRYFTAELIIRGTGL